MIISVRRKEGKKDAWKGNTKVDYEVVTQTHVTLDASSCTVRRVAELLKRQLDMPVVGHRAVWSLFQDIWSESAQHPWKAPHLDVCRCLPYDIMHIIFEGVLVLHCRRLLTILFELVVRKAAFSHCMLAVWKAAKAVSPKRKKRNEDEEVKQPGYKRRYQQQYPGLPSPPPPNRSYELFLEAVKIQPRGWKHPCCPAHDSTREQQQEASPDLSYKCPTH